MQVGLLEALGQPAVRSRLAHLDAQARRGRDVTYIPIKDGIHDLFLSRRDVRDKVYETIFDWMKVNV